MNLSVMLLSIFLACLGSLHGAHGKRIVKRSEILEGVNIAREVGKGRINHEYKIKGVQGPGGQKKDLSLRTTSAFSEETTVTDANGLKKKAEMSSQTLVAADDEDSFALLSVNMLSGETQGIVISNDGEGKRKALKFHQGRKGKAAMVEAEEFTPPAWSCTELLPPSVDGGDESLTDGGRKLDEYLDLEHGEHKYSHTSHHHVHFDGSEDPLETLTDLKTSLRHSKMGRVGRKLDQSYYTDNGGQYTYQADIYVEIDQAFVDNHGSLPAAQAYVDLLFSGMNTFYEKEVDTHLQVAGVDQTSRYNGDNYPSNALTTMRTYWDGQGHFATNNLELHHFLSGRNLGGGVAYLGVLCDQNYGYGVSANMAGDFSDISAAAVWDLTVVAHELGHNFNAPHTHDFNPVIDNCGGGGSCPSPSGSGMATIMSYCHQCSGGNTNIAYTLGGYRTGANTWVDTPGNSFNNDSKRLPKAMYDHVFGSKDSVCLVVDTSPPTTSGPTTTTITPTTTTTTPATITTTPNQCTNGEKKLEISILTDNYPGETTYNVVNICTDPDAEVASGGPFENGATQYDTEICLPPGQYKFTIYDTWGDGICCAYGSGSYEVTYDSNIVASGGVFASEEEETFGDECSASTTTTTTTATTTPVTTTTSTTTSTTVGSAGFYEFSIETDYWASDYSWTLIQDDNTQLLAQSFCNNGYFTYSISEDLPSNACFDFTIYDSYSDGLIDWEETGNFQFRYNGVIILSDDGSSSWAWKSVNFGDKVDCLQPTVTQGMPSGEVKERNVPKGQRKKNANANGQRKKNLSE